MNCEKCGVEPIVRFPKHLGLPHDTYLVRVFDSAIQPVVEYDNIIQEIDKYTSELEKTDPPTEEYFRLYQKGIREAEDKYGEDKIQQVTTYEQMVNTVEAKFVCRYCVGWSDEYE